MAKVTARNDRPVRKWRGINGRQLVLTREGRLLLRHTRRGRYIIVRTFATKESAEHLAEVYSCYEPVMLDV